MQAASYGGSRLEPVSIVEDGVLEAFYYAADDNGGGPDVSTEGKYTFSITHYSL